MRIAIIGVSGAVGQEFLKILTERCFPIDNLTLFGSKRSAGKKISFKGENLVIKELKHNDDFKNIDIAFTSAGAKTSKEYASVITRHGTIMIDNSSAFRYDNDVPLVVPEVNHEDAKNRPRGIIANPNCSTIQLVMALKPIDNISPITKVHVATYQAASGAGAEGVSELEKQIKQVASGEKATTKKFQHQLAMNIIPHIDIFLDNNYTKEEMKMLWETQKIMHTTATVSATCVRIPVARAHSEAIWVETEREVSVKEVNKAFAEFEGLTLLDQPSKNQYPMPLDISGKDNVYIGRVRKDIANPNGITFWCVGDQIRKGAALNAVQIAEYMVKEKEV